MLNLVTGCSDLFANAFTYVPVQDEAGIPVECEVDAQPPSAEFAFVVNGETVSFTDLSTGNPTAWDWNFGDGTTSTEQNPAHTYPPGAASYNVTLRVSNEVGTSDPTLMTVTIGSTDPPTASFSFSVTDQTASFTDLSSNSPTSWSWDFGDGTTSTEQNLVHTYPPVDGTYTVTLTASNEFGSSTPFTQDVTIQGPMDPPTADFSFVVQNLTVAFTDLSSGDPTSWLWDFGDGETSTLQDPVHTYPPGRGDLHCDAHRDERVWQQRSVLGTGDDRAGGTIRQPPESHAAAVEDPGGRMAPGSAEDRPHVE